MMTQGKPPLTLGRRLEHARLRLQREKRIMTLNFKVRRHSSPGFDQKPVALFNASTRLGGFSQNAAFNLITSWGLQLAHHPVIHFTCRSGMSRCVLGTNPDNFAEAPPCRSCVSLSKRLQLSAPTYWFTYRSDPHLDEEITRSRLDELSKFQWMIKDQDLSINGKAVPLGELVMPSLRWALRRHHLPENELTLSYLRAYIQSAYQVVVSFDRFLSKIDPVAVVVFNGIMFPEAAARWVAKTRGFRVITHEVGFQPYSGFFTDKQATAYPMVIPASFQLTKEQDQQLDAYLSQRFRGDFTMAGIQFWPEMRGLGDDFLTDARKFKCIVPVFTNVINDTSQVHASSVFSNMFDWLDHVLRVIKAHHEVFFIIRAHPDEKRRGTRKHSREPVSDWVTRHGVAQLPNVLFVDSNEPLSSYELIEKSKFVMVYNSSIGLEAALLGVPVLCGGKARYTQYPTVFFPQTPEEYLSKAEQFLALPSIEVPEVFQRNARRVLYWQLFRASLPFDSYLASHPTPGYVQLKGFSWQHLDMENSTVIRVLVDGITKGEPFLLPE